MNHVSRRILGFLLCLSGFGLAMFSHNIWVGENDWDFTVKFQNGATPESDYEQVIFDVVDVYFFNPSNFQVVVTGHTAPWHDEKSIDLSKQRARKIANILMERGIPENQIHIVSMGSRESLPRNKHETTTLWERRLERVDILVTSSKTARVILSEYSEQEE